MHRSDKYILVTCEEGETIKHEPATELEDEPIT